MTKQFNAKYLREERNGRDFWTCELWADGVFLGIGNGNTQAAAKKNAINNYHKELEKYEQTSY